MADSRGEFKFHKTNDFKVCRPSDLPPTAQLYWIGSPNKQPIRLVTDVYICGGSVRREAHTKGRGSEKDDRRPTYMLQQIFCFQVLQRHGGCSNCRFLHQTLDPKPNKYNEMPFVACAKLLHERWRQAGFDDGEKAPPEYGYDWIRPTIEDQRLLQVHHVTPFSFLTAEQERIGAVPMKGGNAGQSAGAAKDFQSTGVQATDVQENDFQSTDAELKAVQSTDGAKVVRNTEFLEDKQSS